MLSKEEELRVASFIDVLRSEREQCTVYSEFKTEALLWLSEKCKELNDELKELTTKYEKATEL